ncbi:MAG: hypothetical protein KC431_17300, partial [Myxococcales bacterium]|nr:hypothetical protein [Myxococcales bacterium]
AVLAGALAVAPATSSLSRASLLPTDAAMLPVLLLFELALGTVLGLAASLCGWALLGASVESERGLGLGNAEADERPRS